MQVLKLLILSGVTYFFTFFSAIADVNQARKKSFYPHDVTYNSKIEKPNKHIGHELGEHIVRNDLLVQYLRYLAVVSDRVTAQTIAYSHEGRPIIALTITSPENHARLDEIKKAHISLSNPRKNQNITKDMPVITWMNYGVHGYEISSTDAALPTAYYLAAAQGDKIEKTLKNSVIILVASFNPDGSSRQSAWNHMHGSNTVVTDPRHRLHNVFWPGGRTNHYWFDLNRQWLLVQHPEPQGWVKKFHEWKPNITADFHEMGTNKTYYFHPGVSDRSFPHIPKESMALLAEVANRPRSFMDSEARLYYSEESFDNFYIGKGSTYPHVNASIGVLFEQAHSEGFIESVNGIVSFRDNIRTHFRNSLEIVRAGFEMRPKLLGYQKRFYKNTAKLAQKDKIKAYVFSSPKDKARSYHATEMLNRHQITVHSVKKTFKVGKKTFKAGESFIVKTDQSQYIMIKSLFEKVTKFENNTFYDVSGWTLPLAFGMKYAELPGLKASIIGSPIVNTFPSAPAPVKSEIAYLFEWNEYYAPRALYALLNKGLRPKVAMKPFKISTKDGIRNMQRGSIMIPAGWQGGESQRDLLKIMTEISRKNGLKIHSATSIHTPMSGQDLGGPSFIPIMRPNILLLTGEGVNPSDAGEIWHLLDKRMEIPVTLYDQRNLKSLDLKRYSHIIYGGGRFGSDPKIADKIKAWASSGGTIIAHSTGASWVSKNILGRSIHKIKNAHEGERNSYASKQMNDIEHIIGGAIMKGELDITHPIGFGYMNKIIHSQRNSLLSFIPSKDPYSTVVLIPKDALATGYASPSNQKSLAGKAMLTAQRLGSGSVILFANNPNFRAYFYGTNKLFLNGLFFSKAFRNGK